MGLPTSEDIFGVRRLSNQRCHHRTVFPFQVGATDQCCLVPTKRIRGFSWLLGPSRPLCFSKAVGTDVFLGYPMAPASQPQPDQHVLGTESHSSRYRGQPWGPGQRFSLPGPAATGEGLWQCPPLRAVQEQQVLEQSSTLHPRGLLHVTPSRAPGHGSSEASWLDEGWMLWVVVMGKDREMVRELCNLAIFIHW